MSRIDKAISNSRQITFDRWDSSILERTPLNTGIFPIGSIIKKSVTAVETISEMLKDSLHYRLTSRLIKLIGSSILIPFGTSDCFRIVSSAVRKKLHLEIIAHATGNESTFLNPVLFKESAFFSISAFSCISIAVLIVKRTIKTAIIKIYFHNITIKQ